MVSVSCSLWRAYANGWQAPSHRRPSPAALSVATKYPNGGETGERVLFSRRLAKWKDNRPSISSWADKQEGGIRLVVVGLR